MPRRPARIRLSPWIESLILSYGSHPQVEEGGGGNSSSGWLKAHVIGVGPMSQSQAQGSEGPTALLFLSDDVLQIPAMLTESAWERLQYQEERESLASLLNTTVYIQDYQLQFHMVLEKTRCRFFLSVGELATTAAGPVRENTPCCTTLPSVRQKICETWRLLLDQETQSSQRSQSGFNLSDLLGEWQQDCLQTVLQDVRERLMTASSRPLSPQPSTSLMTHPETLTATGWDVDRVRYKGEKCFTVPVKCLLIPEEDALQLRTPPLAGSRTPSEPTAPSEDSRGDSSEVCNSPESAQLSVDDAEWRIGQPAVLEMVCDAKESAPLPVEQSVLHEDVVVGTIRGDIRPLTNPWDIFPPPGDTSSSSCVSSEATPTHSPHDHTVVKSEPDHAAVLTSTQFPVQSSKEPQQTSEQSILPPYQLRLPSTSHPASVGSSTSSCVKTPEPFTRLSNLSPAADKHHTDPGASNEVSQEKRKSGKAKRKSSVLTPEAGVDGEEEEEAQISRSPPSWLFDSQADDGAKEDSSQHQGQTVLRKTPTVHSDGKRFSYSYQVSGQNLQDFSQFKVAGSLLHWAVKYLVTPKQTDNPHDTSVTSNQTSPGRTEVTSN